MMGLGRFDVIGPVVYSRLAIGSAAPGRSQGVLWLPVMAGGWGVARTRFSLLTEGCRTGSFLQNSP